MGGAEGSSWAAKISRFSQPGQRFLVIILDKIEWRKFADWQILARKG